MISLATRTIAEERMDADDLDAATYADVVADLARVNVMTLAARPTLRFLDRASQGAQRLKILDIGFGDGDMLRRIARWASRRRLAVELVGVDLNPRSELAARHHTPAALSIRYVTGDYVDLAGQGWDCIISSLVAHHMTHAQLITFLRFMQAQARRGWFINDLQRHQVAYHGFTLLGALMRWHPIVRHDGALSVARAYRAEEWPPFLAEAGVINARVLRQFPFRLCVEHLS